MVINDWHYEKAHPTPVLFAAKGFNVVACPWQTVEVALNQVKMMNMFKENASKEMKPRYAGIMQTFWNNTRIFIDGMNDATEESKNDPSVQTFKELTKIW